MNLTSLRLDSNPITSSTWSQRAAPLRPLRNCILCSVKSPSSSLSIAESSLNRIHSLSQVSGVLGTQWGDEGKGKLVDILAQHFDIVARCQAIPNLDGHPFQVVFYDGETAAFKRKSQHETIILGVCAGASKLVNGDRNVSMSAIIYREGMSMRFGLTAEPKMLSIHDLDLSIDYSHVHLRALKEYLGIKGIDARMMSILFDCFSKQPKQKNSWPTEDYMCRTTLPSDGFLGLPFDVKDGGPDEGYLNLVRHCGDEIIEVKVRPYYGFDCRISWRDESFAGARERVLKFFGVHEKVEDRGSAYDDEVEEEMKLDDKDIECLYMIVKIYYGDGYKKLQKFLVFAEPDDVKFPIIYVSVEGVHNHLEEFEGFLKQRGIEPNNINILFNDLRSK